MRSACWQGFVSLVLCATAQAVAFAIPDGYYAGTTSEGYGVGLEVSNSGATQARIRITANIYTGTGTLAGQDTFDETRSAWIVDEAFSNIPMADTSTTGGGTPRWNASGTFNSRLSCVGAKCVYVYTNTTGDFYWTRNLPTSDPNQRRTSENLTFTVSYLGTSVPGSGPSWVDAASLSSSSVRVTWAGTVGALRYGLERSTSSTTGYTLYSYPTITADTISGLSANTTYYIRVRTENIWGWTAYSPYTSVRTAPAIPTSVSASSLSSSAIRVTWTASGGADSYRVYRSTTSTGTYSVVDTVAGTAFDNTGLPALSHYYYKVVAVNSEGSASGQSSYADAYTGPPAPTGVSATALSASSIQLSWTASSGASAYYLYRSLSSSSGYSYIGNTSLTSYTNASGLSSGTRYYYRIRAYASSAYSDSTAAVAALTYPGVPAGLAVTPGASGGADLTWTAVTGASQYQVVRSATSGGSYSAIANIATNSYFDGTVSAGSTWYYKVSASNASGTSAQCSYVAVTLPPAVPTSVTATATSSTTMTISWTPATGASTYSVFMSTDSLVGYSLAGSTSASTLGATGLITARKYYCKVSATNGGGTSAMSAVASGTTQCSAPATPTLTTVSSSRIDVTWIAVTGAVSYNVYRSTLSAGPYSSLGQTASLSYSSTGLSAGTSYYFKVAAINAGGESAQSSYAGTTTISAPPTGVTASASGYSINVGWSPSTGATSYTVYRSATSGGTYDSIGTTAGTSFLNSSLAANATWYYKVNARNAGGVSALSSFAGATTVPAAPGGLTATTQSSNAVSLSWPASTGASSYAVYASTAAASPGSLAGTTTGLAYSATGLAANTRYYFRVTAANSSGSSSYSDSSVTTTAPATPVGVAVTPSSSSALSVSWTCSGGATSYEVFRSQSNGGPYVSIGTSATCSYLSSSLTDATTYYYRITAVSVNGTSAQSATASGTTLAQPVLSVSVSEITLATLAGGTPGNVTFDVANAGTGSMSYTLSKTQAWVSISPTSGSASTEIDPITVSFASSGLAVGTYHDTIVVTAAGATGSPKRLPVRLTVSAAPVPLIGLSASSMSATCRTGSSPATRALLVRNSGTGTLSYTVTDNQTWLSVNPTSGTSTGEYDSISLNFATSGLSAGSYGATVTVNDPAASNNPQTLNITLAVEPQPQSQLAVAPASLTPMTVQGASPSSETIRVWNTGDTTLSYTISSSQSWLSVLPSSGTCVSEVDTITLSYATEGLSAGNHAATITVTDLSGASGPGTVSVLLTVSAAPVPAIAVSPANLHFISAAGSVPTSAPLRLWNAGTGTLVYDLLASQSWLRTSASHGSSMGETDTITLSLDVATLDTGSYTGFVVVSDSAGVAVPETVTVSLRIDPVPVPIVGLSDHQIAVSAETGGSSAPQAFSVWNAGAQSLAYRTITRHSWCSVAPSSGTSTGEPDTLQVACNAVGLNPGTYTCAVVVVDTSDTNNADSLIVTFTVTSQAMPGIALNPKALNVSTTKGGSVSGTALMISNSGSAPLSWVLATDQPWLNALPVSGATAPNHVSTAQIQCSVSGLDTGFHVARIVVSDAGGAATPETATIYLRIDPAPTPVVGVFPSALARSANAGRSPTPDTFSIANTGDAALTFVVGTDVPWILVTPDTGHCATGSQRLVIITYATEGLDTGAHTGYVVVRDSSDPAVRAESVLVSLTIQENLPPRVQVTPSELSYRSRTGDSLITGWFVVSNTGGGTLNYRIRSSQPWMAIDSTPATVSTETDSVRLTVLAWQLDTGFFQAHAIVEHVDGSGTPDTCFIEVLITPRPTITFSRVPAEGDTLYSGTVTRIGWVAQGDFTHARLSWSADDGASWIPAADSLDPTALFSWRLPDTGVANARLKVEVLGPVDSAATATTHGFFLRRNHAPRIEMPDTFHITHPDSTILAVKVVDIDGDSVSLRLSALPSWASIKAGSAGWRLAFEVLPGDTPAVLSISATDVHGLSDTHTVVLTVDLTPVLARAHLLPAIDMVSSARWVDGTLVVSYGVASARGVRIDIYGADGRRIAQLPLSRQTGWHQARWRDVGGSGFYILRARAGNSMRTFRVVAHD